MDARELYDRMHEQKRTDRGRELSEKVGEALEEYVHFVTGGEAPIAAWAAVAEVQNLEMLDAGESVTIVADPPQQLPSTLRGVLRSVGDA